MLHRNPDTTDGRGMSEGGVRKNNLFTFLLGSSPLYYTDTDTVSPITRVVVDNPASKYL